MPHRDRPPFPADSRTDQRARPRAARDRPRRRSTIAARSSPQLGTATCSAGMKRVFKTKGPVVIYPGVGHRRVGSGARQHALAGRPRADVRDRPLRDAVAARWPSGSASRSSSSPATGGTAPIPRRSRRGCAADKAHAIKAVCVVHNETSTGVTSRIAEVRKAIDRARHPALFMVDTISSLASIDYRHDEWGVDVTVGGSQKGLMLPPGPVVQRDQRQGARRVARRRSCRAPTGTGTRCWRPTRTASFPTRRRPTCSTACDEALTMLLDEEGLDERLRAPRRATPRRRGARCARGASRCCALDPARVLELADRGADAGGPRRRRASRKVVLERFDMSLGSGPRQARRQGLPHRPPRRLQRPDAAAARSAASRWASRSPACRTRRAASTPRWSISPSAGATETARRRNAPARHRTTTNQEEEEPMQRHGHPCAPRQRSLRFGGRQRAGGAGSRPRPVEIVVPAGAGGASDQMARLLQAVDRTSTSS